MQVVIEFSESADNVKQEIAVQLDLTIDALNARKVGRFVYLDIPNEAEANRLAQRLRSIPGVSAAYVKPPDALP